MNTIGIDKKKCIGDGVCVETCPIRILRMNLDAKPEYVPGGAEICIGCGHCFAVCPHGAITFSSLNADNAVKLDRSKLPDKESLELLLKGRRSIRVYKSDPVSKETIEKLIDIARYAPSGINRQPVNWAVISGHDKVRELGGIVSNWMEGLVNARSQMAESLRFDRIIESWKKGDDRICRGAPCIVIAYGLKDDPLVPQSCTISASYLELAASGAGLGACWAGYVAMAINSSDEARKFTRLSPRALAGAAMMIGYPKHRYFRIPARNPVKILWK